MESSTATASAPRAPAGKEPEAGFEQTNPFFGPGKAGTTAAATPASSSRSQAKDTDDRSAGCGGTVRIAIAVIAILGIALGVGLGVGLRSSNSTSSQGTTRPASRVDFSISIARISSSSLLGLPTGVSDLRNSIATALSVPPTSVVINAIVDTGSAGGASSRVDVSIITTTASGSADNVLASAVAAALSAPNVTASTLSSFISLYGRTLNVTLADVGVQSILTVAALSQLPTPSATASSSSSATATQTATSTQSSTASSTGTASSTSSSTGTSSSTSSSTSIGSSTSTMTATSSTTATQTASSTASSTGTSTSTGSSVPSLTPTGTASSTSTTTATQTTTSSMTGTTTATSSSTTTSSMTGTSSVTATQTSTGTSSSTSSLTSSASATSTQTASASRTATATTTASASMPPPIGFVSTLAGSTLGTVDGIGTAARFNAPFGVVSDGAGSLYVSDSGSNIIRKVTQSTANVVTIAGNAAAAGGNVDGVGTAATFNTPYGVAYDATNSLLYVANSASHTIRYITVTTRQVTTLSGFPGFSGRTDGAGSSVTFNTPGGVALDGNGNLFVADTANNIIRKIVLSTVTVSTLAGSVQGWADGTGTSASFYSPYGVACDATSVYVADTNNNLIRKVVISSQVVTTLVGSRGGSAARVDGTGSVAKFNWPYGLALDTAGNMYVADNVNQAIRQIVVSTGAVTTLSGSGTAGFSNGVASAAKFYYPTGVWAAGSNALFVVDSNNRVRQVQVSN